MSEQPNIPEEEATDSPRSNEENSRPIEENIQPVAESEILNPKSETEMEVHKHPHHATHKKKWGEYFLEFLMLFLAVFLGFVAENLREHYVERIRAKQFAKSLTEDLSRDTVELRNCKLHMTIIADAMDSLRVLLKAKELKRITGNRLYYYGRQLTNDPPFIPYDATFEQLKSSGSLRYFENYSLIKMITEYDRTTRTMVFDQNNDVGTHYSHQLQAYFFDINLIELIKIKDRTDWSFENDSALHIQQGLLSYDPAQLQQLNQFTRLKSLALRRFSRRTEPKLKEARELIEKLKEEYHLEN